MGSQMCTAVAPGEMQEKSKQKEPHSTGDLSAPASPQHLRRDPPDAAPESKRHSEKEHINWPKKKNDTE